MSSCIYCGKKYDLSKSDIVPDALTNAKVINNCVCRIEHNNKFSDDFESKVIEALAFITNELDIKSSKSKQFPKYDATFNIAGTEYSASTRGDFDLLNGRILKTYDGKIGLTSIKKANKIVKDKEKILPIDVNDVVIEKKVNIDLSIFFNISMFRLISKIAFEWYCLKNNILEPRQEFNIIVNFIVSGEGDNPVSIIQNRKLYDFFEYKKNLGSHTLIAFIDNDKKVNVIIDLFGIAKYRVILCNDIPENCNNNLVYQELRTDSKKIEIISEDIADLAEKVNKFLSSESDFQCGEEIYGVKLMFSKRILSFDIELALFIIEAVNVISQLKDDITVPNKTINEILISNINNILQNSLLHKKSLKRFVNDNYNGRTEPIIINPKSGDKKTFFLLYILMKLGEKNIKGMNESLLQQLVKEIFDINQLNEVIITDEIEEKIKNEILGTKEYSNLIYKGAKVILDWN